MAKKTPEEHAEEQIEEARQTGTNMLNLSQLGLTAVPESIANMFQILDLSRNQPTTVPESLSQLTQLQEGIASDFQRGFLALERESQSKVDDPQLRRTVMAPYNLSKTQGDVYDND